MQIKCNLHDCVPFRVSCIIMFSHFLISESAYNEHIPIFFIQTVYTRKRTFQAKAMMFADKKIPIFIIIEKACSLAIWCEVQKIKDENGIDKHRRGPHTSANNDIEVYLGTCSASWEFQPPHPIPLAP
jgi:hypothetical protein